jgi:hypothetical protein
MWIIAMHRLPYNQLHGRVYLPDSCTRSLQRLHVALSIDGHHSVMFSLVSCIATC